jgi:hypothetical protein
VLPPLRNKTTTFTGNQKLEFLVMMSINKKLVILSSRFYGRQRPRLAGSMCFDAARFPSLSRRPKKGTSAKRGKTDEFRPDVWYGASRGGQDD